MKQVFTRASFLSIGLFCLLLAFSAHGTILLPEAYAPQATFDAAVEKTMQDKAIVGCAVGIIEGGSVVYIGTYGDADREAGIPVTRESSFRWASISKSLTAVATMQLVAADKLDLSRDVRAYVPEWPEGESIITAQQLLCHQGGIVHYRNGKVIRTRRDYEMDHPFTSVLNALDLFKASPLVSKPGTAYHYTTHGYILLSAVVERAGKQRYWDQVQERIATPLGMKTLHPDHAHMEIPNRVAGYRKVKGKILRSFDDNVGWKLGGGGFTSSIDDLARFAVGLLDDTLLPQSMREQMWTRQKTISGKATSYGLGFFVKGQGDQLRVSHGGAQSKTRTQLMLYPEQGRGVIFMTNCEYADPKALANQMLGHWTEHRTAETKAPENLSSW
jgi:CubicO group peptidase (beta-lactamase class C family)